VIYFKLLHRRLFEGPSDIHKKSQVFSLRLEMQTQIFPYTKPEGYNYMTATFGL
jgi:hypothetical protein